MSTTVIPCIDRAMAVPHTGAGDAHAASWLLIYSVASGSDRVSVDVS